MWNWFRNLFKPLDPAEKQRRADMKFLKKHHICPRHLVRMEIASVRVVGIRFLCEKCQRDLETQILREAAAIRKRMQWSESEIIEL